MKINKLISLLFLLPLISIAEVFQSGYIHDWQSEFTVIELHTDGKIHSTSAGKPVVYDTTVVWFDIDKYGKVIDIKFAPDWTYNVFGWSWSDTGPLKGWQYILDLSIWIYIP